MTSPTPASTMARTMSRTLARTTYALSALPLAVPAFVVAVVGTVVGVSLSFTVVGVLVLAATAVAARGFSQLERLRLAHLLDRDAEPAGYAVRDETDGWLRRRLTPLRDPQSWLDLLWCVLGLVTGTAAFAVVAAWWTATGVGLTYWFWQRWVPVSRDETGLAELLGLGEGRVAESLVQLVLGALALVLAPLVVRAAVAPHAGLAATLLTSRRRTAARSAAAARPSAAAA